MFPQNLQKSIKIKVVSAQFGAQKLNIMKPKAIIVSGYVKLNDSYRIAFATGEYYTHP